MSTTREIVYGGLGALSLAAAVLVVLGTYLVLDRFRVRRGRLVLFSNEVWAPAGIVLVGTFLAAILFGISTALMHAVIVATNF